MTRDILRAFKGEIPVIPTSAGVKGKSRFDIGPRSVLYRLMTATEEDDWGGEPRNSYMVIRVLHKDALMAWLATRIREIEDEERTEFPEDEEWG